MIYLDVESCGLHGVPVLLQYAEDDGPVILHEIWKTPICETLDLLEYICSQEICGFNLAFDFFHLNKIYTMLYDYPNLRAFPEDIIDELGVIEEKSRFKDICIKPKAACDIMLHARKGPFQSLMDRDDIRIRKVPTAIAWILAEELEKRIQFDDIYFARAKDKFAPKWKVYDITKNGVVNPDFKDIKLKFKAAGGLKNLYRHAFKITEPMFQYSDIEIDKRYWPAELGYAPYALAIAKDYPRTKRWKGTWPQVISHHILHWAVHKDARKYAADDVRYTRRLHKEVFNSVPAGDDDSELACMVACCRWKGYAVDTDELLNLRNKAIQKVAKTPTAPKQVRAYIEQVLDPIEKVVIEGSTKKVVLEEIAEWKLDDDSPHPAAVRAREVLDARMAAKEIEIYDKLLLAKRFHASFKVVGALSGRMSGADKFNPQGIKHQKYVRRAFPLADSLPILRERIAKTLEIPVEQVPIFDLGGGDFKSYEVSLAAAVFKDDDLTRALQEGKKIHALFGMELFPGKTYEEILASEGTDNDMYDKGKKGIFAIFYGGEAYTLQTRLGVPLEVAEKAFLGLNRRFKGIARFGQQVYEDFASLQQPGGIGTAVYWREPKDYAESFLGFRRYFTLENKIVKALFELAQNPTEALKSVKVKVVRRERVQSASGAACSALYGAAFGIMSAVIRAAKNHYIQSPGAQITKAVQRSIWDLQPVGPSKWMVQPFNVHDEIMCPMRPEIKQAVKERVMQTVERYRDRVPLLAIDWFTDMPNWAGKKG